MPVNMIADVFRSVFFVCYCYEFRNNDALNNTCNLGSFLSRVNSADRGVGPAILNMFNRDSNNYILSPFQWLFAEHIDIYTGHWFKKSEPMASSVTGQDFLQQ